MRPDERLARFFALKWRSAAHLIALLLATLLTLVRPSRWRRTSADVLAAQVVEIGVEAVGFTSRVALLVGVAVVVETQFWVGRLRQSQLLGPVLVTVIVRELGPLLTSFIVIGRSGSAMAAELAGMEVAGEVRAIDALGVDPVIYLVVPRIFAVTLSVFCLAIVFVVVSFVSGYSFAVLAGVKTGGAVGFADSVARSVGARDVLNFLAKTIVPGMLAGAICCTEGLSASHAVTDVPKATSRAVQRSVAALFFVSAAVSFLTYGS